jgi:hypothetical protein
VAKTAFQQTMSLAWAIALRIVAGFGSAVPDPLGDQLEQRVLGPADRLQQVLVILGVLVQGRDVLVEFLPQRDVDLQVGLHRVHRDTGLDQAGDEGPGILG